MPLRTLIGTRKSTIASFELVDRRVFIQLVSGGGLEKELMSMCIQSKVISPHFLTAKFFFHQVDHHHHYHHHHRQSLWTAKLKQVMCP
uniref:Uncharacterized protein n=1 Tax=Glossina pallidipes TaxID=7398 RepID=A0A1B0AAS3_GLOPL